MGLHTMKGLFVIFVIAASAIATAENFEDDAVLSEVSSSIESMKKKGATEADCKDLAKTSCKEVEKERSTDQKIINKLETGEKCLTLGQGGVRKAELHYKRTKKTHYSWKIKVKQALDYKVAFSSRTFSSLKRGHCGFIFSSSSYLKAKAKYSHAVRVEVAWRGRVTESRKVVLTMRKVAKRMVKKCQCATKAQYYQVWRTVTKTTRVARQNKAHAKCKMMACVLKGTPLTSKKCKGSLPPFKRKKLHSATAKVSCSGSDAERGTKAANKRAEKSRKARATESAKKKFHEKNQKGREKAKKSEAKMKATEQKGKAAKREKSIKESRVKVVEKQGKEVKVKRNSYHLAMVINGGTNTFNYNSALWTNGRVGNFGHGNKKTGWFNKRARTIRLVMRYGRNTRSVTWRHNTNLSLTLLFKGGFRRTGINIHSWRHLGGNNVFGYQNHCNHQGFNAIARGGNFQKTDIRFGIVMNQENNCGTPDSSIGIGMKDAGVTAGGNCRCCNNGGHCGIKKAWAYVYVKEA